MLIFLISFFSFILVSKSFLKPFSTWNWKREVNMLPRFLGELTKFWIWWFTRSKITKGHVVPSVRKSISPIVDNAVEEDVFSLLDLPDLALECILQRLSPAELCSMAAVCSSLRKMCTSDHMWEKHMKQKWDRVIGNAAYQQWQCYIASKNREKLLQNKRANGVFAYFPSFWLNLWKRSKGNEGSTELRSFLPEYSVMAWYLALESGKFWFPAQVFNREVQNGQVGFMLSCYDAELNYDASTDAFVARFSSNGRRTIEDNIEWNRIRAPLVETPANVLHVSDCLNDLKPGDHIEVQWRRNKDFPYGWWYGVVGHLESCNSNESHCQCHLNDTVVLEFKQYTPGSRWRQTMVNRKDHREVGNGADGFYGGIRKVYNEQEVSMWKGLWPTRNLP